MKGTVTMERTDSRTATVTLSLPTIGFITFIVFLILKLTNTVDWNWFWIWFPLWIPWAIYLVVCSLVVIFLTFINKRLE